MDRRVELSSYDRLSKKKNQKKSLEKLIKQSGQAYHSHIRQQRHPKQIERQSGNAFLLEFTLKLNLL